MKGIFVSKTVRKQRRCYFSLHWSDNLMNPLIILIFLVEKKENPFKICNVSLLIILQNEQTGCNWALYSLIDIFFFFSLIYLKVCLCYLYWLNKTNQVFFIFSLDGITD